MEPRHRSADGGNNYIAAIGIDRYRGVDARAGWPRLRNAVNDALGAVEAFKKLGFVEAAPPLLNEDATKPAFARLVVDTLRHLRPADSLVLFFAGHGHTVTQPYPGGSQLGYLIPVDGHDSDGEISSWVRVDTWLHEVTELAPHHILVILDSCHSGIAIDAFDRWVAAAPVHDTPERLQLRRSRQLITSTHADEVASDYGPIAGHSLFTGALIEALGGALAKSTRSAHATVSRLAGFLKQRVGEYPNTEQTPDFGAFIRHEKGELVLQLRPEPVPGKTRKPSRDADTAPLYVAALDRHDADRANGDRVLSVLAGDASSALRAWGAWSARRGALVVAVDAANGNGHDAAIDAALSTMPWLRLLLAARATLAAAARVPATGLDAAIDSRSEGEWQAFVDDISGFDATVRVAGWLLAAVRLGTPDPATAPVRGAELLAAIGKLAAPIALVVQPHDGSASAVERAIGVAAHITHLAPARAVGVVAPADIQATLQGSRGSGALALARQGLVPIVRTAAAPTVGKKSAKSAPLAEQLSAALERDPRTRGLFAVDGDAALLSARMRLGVRIDTWYRITDADAFRRERIGDADQARRFGISISRFLADDVEERLSLVVDEIAICLGSRLAGGVGGSW